MTTKTQLISRSLRVEVLETRRVLSLVPLGADGQPLESFDPIEAGREITEFYRELGVDQGFAGLGSPVPEVGESDPTRTETDMDQTPTSQTLDARQFIAVLSPTSASRSQTDDGPEKAGTDDVRSGSESSMPGWMRGGVARFFQRRDDTVLQYRIRVPRLAQIHSAVVRLGRPGENGPAVATLFHFDEGGDADGVAVRGELGNADVSRHDELGFDGTVPSLVQAMRDGNAYVEVGVTGSAQGLRGAVEPLSWRPWQNPLNRMDVTADRMVTPRDVLAILGDLQERGARLLMPPAPGEPIGSRPFSDVTGDNIVSPHDALTLIQFLSDRADRLAGGVGQFPETVGVTVGELMDVLEIDPEELSSVDGGSFLDRTLDQRATEIEALIDGLADELQRRQLERFYERTGNDDPFSLIEEIDWTRMRAEP